MLVSIAESFNLRGLHRHVMHEGDVVTNVASDVDVVIKGSMVLPYIQGTVQRPTHFVTKFWTGKEFIDQCAVGVPLTGHMNNDLGCQQAVGCSIKFIDPEHPLSKWFEVDKFSGIDPDFITAVWHRDQMVHAMTGVPFWGLYALLEGRRGKVSEVYSNPRKLLESPSVALAVSAFPWPSSDVVREYSLPDITREFEKHFWLFEHEGFRRSITSTSGVIGIATAWDRHSIEKACDIVYQTAHCVSHSEKQYRTDLWRSVKYQWTFLREAGII